MRRRTFVAALACTLLAPSASRAGPQSPGKRIGFLGTATQAGYADYIAALHGGLRELGWIEGRNVGFEYVWANGDYSKLSALAQHLVASRPDVLVTHGTPGTRALQAATREIPIVMAVTGDAVATGLVRSFGDPGGNTTGQSFLGADMSAKRVELLLETAPGLKRVAAVFNTDNPFAQIDLRTLGSLAAARGIAFKPFAVDKGGEFQTLFSRVSEEDFQAISIIHDSVLTSAVAVLAALSLQYRLLSIGEGSFVKAGGMIGYGPDFRVMWRKTASYVDKILRGIRPNDIPVEVPTKFETLLNLKTARALDVSFPPNLLARADEILD